MLLDVIQTKLDSLPHSPGVYKFIGDEGRVLYVGKARSLRSRVRSYFQPGSSDVRAFVSRLSSELIDIETFVTRTEKEAALLENQLIKASRPKYNVKLRDDKEFLSLRLDPKKDWPRLEVVRRPRNDRALYFGPYHSASSARKALALVNRHFQLRTCTDVDFRTRKRPCLQHQIKRCPAPCVLKIDHDAYQAQVANVARFLDGRHGELVNDLKRRMKTASGLMQYEQAATFRDQLHAVEGVREKQRVASNTDEEFDVHGLYREGDHAEVAVLRVRGGRLFGVDSYSLRQLTAPSDEVTASFLRDYYEAQSRVPPLVVVSIEFELMQGVGELLSEIRGSNVEVRWAQRGEKAKLVDLANENAQHAFVEKQRALEDIDKRLADIQRSLRLGSMPRAMECVDISHSSGSHTSAVLVSMVDGKLERSGYRSFRIKQHTGGDDYTALYEVVFRRLRRGVEGQRGWELPDLLVVDGGRGQLNAAVRAAHDAGAHDIELAAIAKPRVTAEGEHEGDRIFRPGQKNPVRVASRGALALIMVARDETHRASNELRMKGIKREQLRSELDSIPGLGEKTRNKLLTKLGSVQAVLDASHEELVSAGATKKQAAAIESFTSVSPIDNAFEREGDDSDDDYDDSGTNTTNSAPEATAGSGSPDTPDTPTD